MKTKQEDIAKRLGITRTTVARALNGNGSVKEETRKAVFLMAEELGYKKNTISSVLAMKNKKIIYIFLVKSINEKYTEYLTKGIKDIEREFKFLKFKFEIIETDIEDPDTQAEKLESVLKNNTVSGVIIIPLNKEKINKLISDYEKDIKFIILDSQIDPNTPFIGVDYYYSGEVCATIIDNVLREKEKIFLFNSDDDNISSGKFYKGFYDSISKSNKTIVDMGKISKKCKNDAKRVMDLVEENEIVAVYSPRFLSMLVEEIRLLGADFNKIKIVTQGSDSLTNNLLKSEAVIGAIEENYKIVSYLACKYMIEQIFYDKPIKGINKFVRPTIKFKKDYNYIFDV